MGESQVKFLLIMPKSLIEDVEQASLRLGQSKAAFVRECITHRLKDISGAGTDCQPTAAKEDHIVVGGFEAVDSDAKCNPVDSIGSSTKSRVSHSERRPSARFPGDKDGSARRNIEPLQ